MTRTLQQERLGILKLDQKKWKRRALIFPLYLLYCLSDLSVIRLVIEPPVEVVCLDDIDEGVWVYLLDCFDQDFRFGAGYNRVQHGLLTPGIAADSLKTGSCVVKQMADALVYLVRMAGDDEQRMFFVALVQHLNDLRGSKLKDDGVERRIPAKQQSRYDQDRSVDGKDFVPDIMPQFF